VHVRGTAQPVLEPGAAEQGAVLGDERALTRSASKYRAWGSATTGRGSPTARSAFSTNSSNRNRWGPATSTCSFVGGPTAVRATAVATSSAAIGWKRTGGRWTVPSTVAPSAMPATNSKNCVAWTMDHGIDELSITAAWAALARKYPIADVRRVPTTDRAT
jgi:hypothetical protein